MGRSGESRAHWVGRPQRVSVERQNRRQAVELRHRLLGGILASRDEWNGVRRF
jgi:hypothetical protein